jgi:NAD(P) transhydrogenase beta subunit
MQTNKKTIYELVTESIRLETAATATTADGMVFSKADDPIWIDEAWLDTVVVVGLTCFILCLMGLSKVRHTCNVSYCFTTFVVFGWIRWLDWLTGDPPSLRVQWGSNSAGLLLAMHKHQPTNPSSFSSHTLSLSRYDTQPQVSTSKMGMLYGICGMVALMVAYWANVSYTYGDGVWLVAASMAPGAAVGLISAHNVAMTGLPEMVGAYNGFGGLAAALTAYGLYLDPTSTELIRHGAVVTVQTNAMLWVQAIALILSIVIGMMTFTGSMVAALKLHGIIASRPRVIPLRTLSTLAMFAAMVVFGTLSFTAGQTWNDRGLGIAFLSIVGVLAGAYGIVAVMAIGGGDMPVSISFLNSLSGFSTSAAGFMLSNKALVVAGAFVGCSGIILVRVGARRKNRKHRKKNMDGRLLVVLYIPNAVHGVSIFLFANRLWSCAMP